jgi:hypothetical protein
MTQRKNIWELQHTTICKVVGMALGVNDLKKISRKFAMHGHDIAHNEEFLLHSVIVRMCGEENMISKYVQKHIEHRFSRYARRLLPRAPEEIADLAVKGPVEFQVPLWAIVWHVATRNVANGDQLQTTLFGLIHMLEHRLVRDFWEQPSEEHENREAEQKNEVSRLTRELTKLRTAYGKLERSHERLKNGLVRSVETANRHLPDSVTEHRGVAGFQEKIQRMRSLLAESRERNRQLEEECLQSRQQLKVLTKELLSQETSNSGAVGESRGYASACPLTVCLSGKRIAMVGGIDSLEVHYRHLVEQSGGEFCRHDGRCCRGGRKLEECIRNADLVVCPVSVNSHFGAGGVKKACKRHGISCCFPESAGLGTLRTVLSEHFAPEERCPGETAQSWQ